MDKSIRAHTAHRRIRERGLHNLKRGEQLSGGHGLLAAYYDTLGLDLDTLGLDLDTLGLDLDTLGLDLDQLSAAAAAEREATSAGPD